MSASREQILSDLLGDELKGKNFRRQAEYLTAALVNERYTNAQVAEIAQAEARLQFAEENRVLDTELTKYQNLEAAVVPPGMGFREYTEMLELRIEKFKDFIKHDLYVAFRREERDSVMMRCRYCRHFFDPDNSEQGRLDPRLHFGGCPLNIALQNN